MALKVSLGHIRFTCRLRHTQEMRVHMSSLAEHPRRTSGAFLLVFLTLVVAYHNDHTC